MEWEKREERAKSILGLSLADSQLHFIDLKKSSAAIWEEMNKVFGAKAFNAKFFLKLQLFKLQMESETSLSTHINELRAFMRQLSKINSKVDDDDAKAILLNSLSSKYDNVIFTLSQMPHQSLAEMIAALMAEEKGIGCTEASSHNELALYSKGRMNKNKTECFYCHKYGHTAFNCKIRAQDLLNEKLKKSAYATFSKDSPDADSSSEDEPPDPSLKLF